MPSSHLIAKDSLTNRSTTIGDLRNRAGRIAKGFKDELHPPDQARWAILLPNSVEYLELFHSILWSGGVVCPINYALTASDIGHGLAVTRPRFVVVYGPSIKTICNAVDIAIAELASAGVKWPRPQIMTVVSKRSGYLHVPDNFIKDASLPIPHWDDTTKRLASIHLSSGTTGKSKGVQLTHYNFVANCFQLFAHDHTLFHSGSRTVAYTPWAHIANTILPQIVGPYTGMMHHAMPAYNLEAFAELVGSNRATSFQGVPSVVLAMATSDITSRYDFSQAQIILVGGLPLKKEMAKNLLSKAPWKFVQVFGMTEAAGYVAHQRFGEKVPDGFVGELLPNIDACLKREGSVEDVPEGEPGELWIRGPNLTKGYAFNEEANKKAFPLPGWYNTGDICKIDKNGLVGVIGRTKELIKYQGFQVSPAELEMYVNSHPLVAEGAVAGLWDEKRLTELPAAWVVLKDHINNDQERLAALRDIQRNIDEQVSGYKRLRGGVWQVAALPKTTTGKVLRKQVSEMTGGICSLDKFIKARL